MDSMEALQPRGKLPPLPDGFVNTAVLQPPELLPDLAPDVADLPLINPVFIPDTKGSEIDRINALWRQKPW